MDCTNFPKHRNMRAVVCKKLPVLIEFSKLFFLSIWKLIILEVFSLEKIVIIYTAVSSVGRI